jgi:hypothetical protein
VIVNVPVSLLHPFTSPVTLIVEVLLVPELLAAVINEGILPAPLAPKPIVVLSFNQLNVPPDGVVENVGILALVFGQ